MTRPPPWIASDPVLDGRTASVEELVAYWRAHTNEHGWMMAAHEMMRRIASGEVEVREKGSQGGG